ncbi:ubiquinol-cytochrome C chaperone [Sphingomonas sp. Leaf24]|uniref:ubiquinol-cytochrome C chaperone family protein n=1 Tax=unclassified Sphingomonas TaxID=196159 RepID=UPI0006FDC298|nr:MULTISPECIES: ubiquinol-cytochrome C chaperone family protein [unclassified Sphingomonas]KQM22505.1 ubiquinol-cytochrome C chaperone [Sphingomonas sp. Leaf5]KQM90331.1 ubiquinol-cytochrome C chaperone [Sphingomonas sp. Leaf22]KQM94200.1 ubiquinol-cytochrome C chaperone [Sphingomonas sp. Leaf24]
MRLPRLFRRAPPPRVAASLYDAVVARGRQPAWYLDGQVPDTLDGRFDMIAAILSMVMLRLEGEGAGAAPAASLAECFVDDMDGQLRQIGFGDMVVGKHIGRMMAMLGGRIGAYRDGLVDGTFESALVRNLYRGVEPDAHALVYVAAHLRRLRAALDAVSVDDLLAGKLPE